MSEWLIILYLALFVVIKCITSSPVSCDRKGLIAQQNTIFIRKFYLKMIRFSFPASPWIWYSSVSFEGFNFNSFSFQVGQIWLQRRCAEAAADRCPHVERASRCWFSLRARNGSRCEVGNKPIRMAVRELFDVFFSPQSLSTVTEVICMWFLSPGSARSRGAEWERFY